MFTVEVPSEVYFHAYLAQLFYKELVSVKTNFSADATTDIFRSFQSTFKTIG